MTVPSTHSITITISDFVFKGTNCYVPRAFLGVRDMLGGFLLGCAQKIAFS